MNELLVVIWVNGLRGIRGAADVDGRLLDIKCPPKTNDLGVGVDAVLPGEARVRVVLAGLDDDVRRSFQVLGNLVDDKIERLRIVNRVVGDKTGVSSQTGFGFLVDIFLGRGRDFLGLEFARQSASAGD